MRARKIATVGSRKIAVATTLCLALVGCGGSSRPPTGYDSSSNYTFATLPNNAALTLTAHQGLEAETISNASAAVPTVALLSNPTASAVTTIYGFNLTLPDNQIFDLTTLSGASDAVGVQDFKTPAVNEGYTVEVVLTNGAASPLTYSTYGIWMESEGENIPIGAGVFATGIPTVVSQMPTTGSASYTGNLSGFVTTATTNARITGGAVALNANFAANTITGSITNVTTLATATGVTGQVNDINLTGGKISGAGFTGTAAPAAATSATSVNITGASGTFGGKFYGPSAAEVGGSLSLSGNNTTLIGAFGAHH